ncbi:hypothetical protein [Streptomyces decoyicus]|uniref:hypothetical protein n=1 Tax=Streptomyces decoyicus TaxID=249567 RepID=UPI00069D3845|nr:hypothetical protein [Streptomyces decoyicus]KOG39442.1 hypothetical protein ADK74_29525 [Streptomyces decoyicus]QZY18231.1 hypothetical protein K7C20_25750 [Streptomyces decoyicus]
MHHVRRSATLTLLLLLAVTFGPLLCRVGGDQAWLSGRAATAAAAWRTGGATAAAPNAAAAAPDATAVAPDAANPAGGATPDWPAAADSGPQLDPDAPVAVVHAPKKCSDRHAPGPDESAPLPTPHRGEPLAPATTGPGPLAADLPAQYALARPPTDGASATDHTTLLPVLRI